MENIKKERLEVMMDMETTDLAETSAILELAIIPFRLDGMSPKEESFHEYIDLTSCYLEGMSFGKKTQEVWVKWETKAKHNLCSSEKKPIRSAIRESYNYLDGYLREDVHLIELFMYIQSFVRLGLSYFYTKKEKVLDMHP